MLRYVILTVCIYTVTSAPVKKPPHGVATRTGPRLYENRLYLARKLKTFRNKVYHLHPETGLGDDETVKEGDIIISKDRSGEVFLWPPTNDVISLPYDLPESLNALAKTILEALKMISSQTCIRFHTRTTETDYLQFIPGPGCASYVGFIGDAQPIYANASCSVGNLCHELLHALGLFHEHTRPDRDQYITVLMDNVLEGKEGNFLKRVGPAPEIQYDLQSIMHYGKYYFSANSNPTILPKDTKATVGQRSYLSDLDVTRINALYNCGP